MTHELNPIKYLDKDFTNRVESLPVEQAKIYKKSNRLLGGTLRNCIECFSQYTYMVPKLFEKPIGFFNTSTYFWMTNSEFWVLELFRLTKNAKHSLANKFNEIISKEDELYKLSKAIKSDVVVPEFKDGFTLREHQTVILDYAAKSNHNLLIADQQRTGKSYTALCYVASKEFETCLIVCPAMLIDVWTNMLNTMHESPQINLLQSHGDIVPGYNIISYDRLHTIDDLTVDICIGDEIHFILEKNARRSVAMNSIRAKHKLALSGTPLMNSSEDILSILYWLDRGLYEEIRHALNGITFKSSYEQTRLITMFLRRRCMLLRQSEQISPQSNLVFNTIKVNCGLDKAASLLQVGEAKIPFAVEYATAYNEKLIIATHYLETARKLAVSLGSQAVVITGETPKAIRKQVQEAFAKDARILIGSSCIAEGLDFSFANRILLVETGYSLRVDQLKERCNRIGKSEMVSVDIMVSPGTKDDRVGELLQRKYEILFGMRDS